MIEGLKKLDILIVEDRHKKELYNAIKKYFDWDIGTYNSIWMKKIIPGTNPGEKSDNESISNSKKRIHFILEQINSVL